MSLRRQLLLTTFSLVAVTVMIATIALLQNGARSALEQEAVGIASAAARASDAAGLQRLADRLLAAGGLRSVLVVDSDIATTAFSAVPTAREDAAVSDSELRSLRVAVEQRRVQTFSDGGAFKVIAPVVDGVGAPTGAVLVSMPADRLQSSMKRQAESAVPYLLGVLVACFLVATLYVFVIMRPVQQLDTAVSRLESYTFDPASLGGLVNRKNELGHVARLLLRVANAEEGWRRSLEEVRQSQSQLELHVNERTQELRESLERQTAISDVLKLISRSAFDLPVVAAELLKSAVRLCEAQAGVIYRRGSGGLELLASFPSDPGFERTLKDLGPELARGSLVGNVDDNSMMINIADVRREAKKDTMAPVYERLGVQTALGLPLVQLASVEDEGSDGSEASRSRGVLVLFRTTQRAFEQEHVELAQTFADQAAIAIENIRLVGEVREKTREVQKLKIEIDHAMREREVNEIVNAEFFKDLQAKAKQMRSGRPNEDGEHMVQEAIDAYVNRLKRELAARSAMS